MAAPTPSVRGTPAGIKLKDGFSTKLTCAANSTISFWEKETGTPGLDGGDPIDQNTMFNVRWRQMAPRQLITLMPFTIKAAYDPNVITHIVAVVNVETTWTVTFPDGSTWAFFGFLQKVEFDQLKEGTQPECTVTVCPTNFDPVNHVEAGPAINNIAGT